MAESSSNWNKHGARRRSARISSQQKSYYCEASRLRIVSSNSVAVGRQKRKRNPVEEADEVMSSSDEKDTSDSNLNRRKKTKKQGDESFCETSETEEGDDVNEYIWADEKENEEDNESITPANLGSKKRPAVLTFVSRSSSTTGTTSNLNTTSKAKSVKNVKHKAIKSKDKTTTVSEKHSLRRLPVSLSIEDESEGKSKGSHCAFSGLKTKENESIMFRNKNKSTSKEFKNTKNSKRKIDNISSSFDVRTKEALDSTSDDNDIPAKTNFPFIKEELKEMNKRAKSSFTKRSAINATIKTEGKKTFIQDNKNNRDSHISNLQPMFNTVPNGVFDLDYMYQSSIYNIKTNSHDNYLSTPNYSSTTSNATIRQQNTKLRKTEQVQTETSQKYFQSSTQTITYNAVPANDNDTIFLAQYGTDYYNYLFQKDKRTNEDAKNYANTNNNKTITNTKIKQKNTKSRSTRSKSKRVLPNKDDPSSTSSTTSAKNITSSPSYMKTQIHLSTPMRGIVVDWLIEISDEYKLKAETLHIAIQLMDRALEIIVIERKDLQCLGCACMLIACKLEEVTPMTSADFVYVSNKTYTRKEITAMERAIFNVLQFRLFEHVTPLQFLYRFCKASEVAYHCQHYYQPEKITGGSEYSVDVDALDGNHISRNKRHIILKTNPMFQSMVEYLLELAILQPEFVNMQSSLVAATALYLGRATMGLKDANGNIWNETLSFYTTYGLDDLEAPVLKLHKVHSSIHDEKLSCVVTKYKCKHFHEVALRPAILKVDLGF